MMLQVCQSSDFDCYTKAVDLVFMVTSASNVRWSDITSFVSAIAGTLNVDSRLARVGFLTSVLCHVYFFIPDSIHIYCKTTKCLFYYLFQSASCWRWDAEFYHLHSYNNLHNYISVWFHIQGGSKQNTPLDNMQYLHNQWSDFRNC